jgi:hypothetical protein
MSDEIKVVITLRGNKGSIGIQSPDCDPVITTHEGDLQSLLEMVPAMVEEANQKWDSNPRYPKCQHELKPPTPPAQAAPRANAQSQQQPTQYQPAMPGL